MTGNVAQMVPVISVLTSNFRVIVPPRPETVHQGWPIAIPYRSNELGAERHEDLLFHTEIIEGVPALLLASLAQDCPNGLAERCYDAAALSALRPETSEQDIREAVFKLEDYGFLAMRDKSAAWSVSLSTSTYLHTDDQLMGWDNVVDTRELASLMLSEDTGHAPTLREKAGWGLRRFHPAFEMLLLIFPFNQKRLVSHPEYPGLDVIITDQDRARLRRLAAKT